MHYHHLFIETFKSQKSVKANKAFPSRNYIVVQVKSGGEQFVYSSGMYMASNPRYLSKSFVKYFGSVVHEHKSEVQSIR